MGHFAAESGDWGLKTSGATIIRRKSESEGTISRRRSENGRREWML